MRLLFLTAGLMIAHQVMGKAARDAFFLTQFDAGWLPAMKIGAAVFAMVAGLGAPALIRRIGLARAVPGAFVVSGLAHMLEFALRGVSAEATAVLVYLHIVGFCAILLSSFWLLMTERFDPAGARRWFGKIAGYGTLGGVVGGLATEGWVAAGYSEMSLLMVMGVVQIVCGLCLLGEGRGAGAAAAEGVQAEMRAGEAMARAPYLRLLAWVVFLGTASAAMVDLWFATAAKAALGGGPELMKFFAGFHTVTQGLIFLAQAFAVRGFLERYGIGSSVGALPLTVAAGALGAAVAPGLAGVTAARGAEYLVRGSLFRSGYEAFYAPIPPAEKRAAKSLIDVVCDRMGDAAGGLVFGLFLRTGAGSVGLMVMGAAAVLAGVNYWLTRRLDRSYSGVVQRGLTDRAQLVNEHLSQYADWSLDTVAVERPGSRETAAAAAAAPGRGLDETTRRLAALRSRDEGLVKRTLGALREVDPVLAPAVVELLGWRAVGGEARAVLERAGSRHAGLLTDWLVDPRTDFQIRRRIPAVLAGCGGRAAAAGLVEGLGDARFEVRLECARGLARMAAGEREAVLGRERLQGALERELSVPAAVWRQAGADEEARGGRLEMVFALLALLHEREGLKVAFRALQAKDRVVQALGVEYVDSLLPAELRPRWRSLMAAGAEPRAGRTAAEVEAMLLASGIREGEEAE